MTQNGPYPGPPWPGGSSDEPYTEPADPWGEHATAETPEPAWGAHPTSMPPAMESSVGYPAPALRCVRVEQPRLRPGVRRPRRRAGGTRRSSRWWSSSAC